TMPSVAYSNGHTSHVLDTYCSRKNANRNRAVALPVDASQKMRLQCAQLVSHKEYAGERNWSIHFCFAQPPAVCADGRAVVPRRGVQLRGGDRIASSAAPGCVQSEGGGDEIRDHDWDYANSGRTTCRRRSAAQTGPVAQRKD